MPTRSARRKTRIAVQFALVPRGVPSAASLRRWAGTVASTLEVTLRVVGAAEARRLNESFRRKRHATNVLSFPYHRGRGDVVLCHPVIAREARDQRKTIAAHYAHLVVHGILHLRGYGHDHARDAARMEQAEIRALSRLGFSNPYELK